MNRPDWLLENNTITETRNSSDNSKHLKYRTNLSNQFELIGARPSKDLYPVVQVKYYDPRVDMNNMVENNQNNYNNYNNNSSEKYGDQSDINDFTDKVFDDEFNNVFDGFAEDFSDELQSRRNSSCVPVKQEHTIKSVERDLADYIKLEQTQESPKKLKMMGGNTFPPNTYQDQILTTYPVMVKSCSSSTTATTQDSDDRIDNFPDSQSCESFEEKFEKVKLWFQNDIRQSYCQLISDAFNSLHITHLKNILYKFSYKNKKIITKKSNHNEMILVEYFYGMNNPYGPNYRILYGIESIGKYLSTVTEALPDVIFSLEDVKLRKIDKIYDTFYNVAEYLYDDITYNSISDNFQSSNNYVLLAKYNFTGTKLFDIDIKQDRKLNKNYSNYNNLEKIQSLFNNTTNNFNNLTINNQLIQNINNNFSINNNYYKKYSFKEANIKLIPINESKLINFIGIMVIPLTIDGKIIRLEFHYKNKFD